ncbi:transport and Golgi organization protein 1 homolog isoform X2 [Betta splendens]|uniref:Transport and Golgi organization protein 1 homolog n=1 Tax=Betta splendens TaxID=158456 RepID=A0A6P7LU65_BETSP|nr:transport and Golgi organization protein 1 homolog isoform X2 [Betta splendens]
MAAKHFYRQGFLLLLFNFIPAAALDKRFSNFKRCADEECSMLLCRGKAVKDFSGPDCRFLSFKKSETVYVYYKLSGMREDMWAGSVGSNFGYFPKHLLAVNHLYTDKELEVPAEETDFVCFDTGFDKFDNYNIDLLLGSSLKESESENKGISDQVPEDTHTKETHSSSAQEEPESENPAELDDKPEVFGKVPDNPSASLHKLVMATELPPTKVVESDTSAPLDATGKAAEGVSGVVVENVLEHSKAKDIPTKSEAERGPEDVRMKEKEIKPVPVSEGVKIPELKTTFGTTFDAVTTDEEITKKVTPYEEEESKDVESHPDAGDVREETPLLSFSKEPVNIPASDSFRLQEIPTATPDDKPVPVSEGVKIPELKTTFGTTFDAVTTDEEITKKVTPYEEEESKDVESHPEVGDDAREETPLISFSKETVSSPASKTFRPQEIPAPTPEDEPVPVSEGVKIPELKTTFGSTFDAVTTDEEITKRVTPYEEEESKDAESNSEAGDYVIEETPLISFSKEPDNIPASDTFRLQEIPTATPDAKPKAAEEKNMWTSIGDAVFSAVTGVETTTHDVSSDDEEDEEEEEEEEEEEVVATPLSSFDESKIDGKEPLNTDPQKVPEELGETLQDPHELSIVQAEDEEEDAVSDSEDESDEDGIEHETDLDEILEPTDETVETDNHTEANVVTVHSVSQAHISANPEVEKSDSKITYEPEGDETVTKVSETIEDVTDTQDSSPVTETVSAQESTTGKDQGSEKVQLNDLVRKEERMVDNSLPSQTHDALVKDGEKMVEEETIVDASPPDQINDPSPNHIAKIEDASLPSHKHDTDLEHNDKQQELVDEPEVHDEVDTEETEDEDDTEEEENENEEKEELLEDENALLLSQSNETDSEKPPPEPVVPDSESVPEPDYSDSILRLTLLREHFTEEQMLRFQKLLGLKNLIRAEAMFSDLDTELRATRLSHASTTTQDIENALESILEASETTILDEIEKMLDSQNSKYNHEHQMDTTGLDEEADLLDGFQELAFSLRHQYSTFRDSTPVATEQASDIDQDKPELNITDVPHLLEEDVVASITENENKNGDNVPVTVHEERPAVTKEEQVGSDAVHVGRDISVEEDGGHFNKNKDNQPGFSEPDEMQKIPQDTLENPLDLGLGVKVENSPSGSLDSMEPVSEIHEEEVGSFSTGAAVMSGLFWMCKRKVEEWTITMISLLPDEWKPGETFFGCPWQAVVATALVGIMSFTLFFWRTVLAVKKKEYLVDEKKLTEQIQALKKEKNDVMEKMSELQKQTEHLKESQKQSKKTVSSTMKKVENLESKVLETEKQNERMVEEKNTYIKLLEEERANSLQNQTRIDKLEKANEKLHLSRKKIQEAFSKTAVLLDEAKIREDARNVHQKSLEKDYTTLKEENKTLKTTIKNWEDKHLELSEQIKVYHKSQKDLEDSLVLKDHNVEVLSELLADLDACDLQKVDNKVLANGEVAPDKKTAIKNRIKQMMDVSRVQTTLSVVEEERDRFMTKLLNEEKARKTLEEQHQELEHSIATLKSEKSHVENQLTILQQKNEIMVEMYQQKENALQQRLTKEELERRSKENLLSEVGGKALEAEEQVKVLRQRINEMEEQMKKTEEVYKEQIKEQENKTHSNWVNARNAERALNQEKLESSKLREKLAVLTSQLNDRRAPLFRPNSGQPSGPRQGDSYGPSPVSGGAPSPPIMIEGPRRPPSAPVGRRIDPYGPRPPSDPHGRYAENKHIPGMDMMGPRSSSPANMDVSGPGSFLASPIRDSPGPMVQGPLPGPGPHEPLLPPGPHGRLPPPGMYRPPRPGPYHLPPGPHGPGPVMPPPLHGPPLPANGQPGMPLPGPMGGDFGPRPANGHTFLPRPGPGLIPDPRGPLPQHFRPPLPSHLGPLPPPTGIRGPIGPRQPLPPDMRFPGPHDHTRSPMDMPPGAPPHPANAYGQAPPSALHNSVGAHSGPRQDLHMKQEAPQDSVKPAMVKP